MSLFDYDDIEALGKVISVDTSSVIVEVLDIEKLKSLQVNRLVVLQSSKAEQFLIGLIEKLVRKKIFDDSLENEDDFLKMVNSVVESETDIYYFREFISLKVDEDIEETCSLDLSKFYDLYDPKKIIENNNFDDVCVTRNIVEFVRPITETMVCVLLFIEHHVALFSWVRYEDYIKTKVAVG